MATINPTRLHILIFVLAAVVGAGAGARVLYSDWPSFERNFLNAHNTSYFERESGMPYAKWLESRLAFCEKAVRERPADDGRGGGIFNDVEASRNLYMRACMNPAAPLPPHSDIVRAFVEHHAKGILWFIVALLLGAWVAGLLIARVVPTGISGVWKWLTGK